MLSTQSLNVSHLKAVHLPSCNKTLSLHFRALILFRLVFLFQKRFTRCRGMKPFHFISGHCRRCELFHPTVVTTLTLVAGHMDAKNSRGLGTPEYWEKRHSSAKEETSHEWFRSFLKLQNFLGRQIANPQTKSTTASSTWAVETAFVFLSEFNKTQFSDPRTPANAMLLWLCFRGHDSCPPRSENLD